MLLYNYFWADRKIQVHLAAGIYPAIFFIEDIRLENVLSIFIDESGDFGEYSSHSAYYMVAMVLHDQNVDISEDIGILDRHIQEIGFPPHAIHIGPIIRRESYYYENQDLHKNNG